MKEFCLNLNCKTKINILLSPHVYTTREEKWEVERERINIIKV